MTDMSHVRTCGRRGRAGLDPAVVPGVVAAAVRRPPRAAGDRRQRGFTLIELMIVVAIVGILASFAIKIYEGALIRAHIADALNLISPMKMMLADNLNLSPSQSACSGIASITTPINSVVRTGCTDIDGEAKVRVEMDASAGGLILDFVSDRSGGSQWRCVAPPAFVDFKYLPGACR